MKKRKLDLPSNEVKYPKLCKWNDNFECLKVPGLFRKSNPLLQPGSRVFCKYDAAFYPATIMDVKPLEVRVIFDDIEMKLNSLLVKKSDILLISELGVGVKARVGKNIIFNMILKSF